MTVCIFCSGGVHFATISAVPSGCKMSTSAPTSAAATAAIAAEIDNLTLAKKALTDALEAVRAAEWALSVAETALSREYPLLDLARTAVADAVKASYTALELIPTCRGVGDGTHKDQTDEAERRAREALDKAINQISPRFPATAPPAAFSPGPSERLAAFDSTAASV